MIIKITRFKCLSVIIMSSFAAYQFSLHICVMKHETVLEGIVNPSHQSDMFC